MAKQPTKRPVREQRLAGYWPILDRLLFAAAILGILVTVHLVIQQGRGFDRGCLGFSSPAAVEATFDCNAVVQSEAGKLFGVSNAYWGLLYYVVIAALGAGVAFASGNYLLRLKQVRAGLIGVGFLYSMYLLAVQTFQIGEFCALCLASASVAALLFILQAVQFYKPVPRTALSSRNVMREVRLVAGLAVLVIVLVGADVVYFNNLEETAVAAQQTPVNMAAGEGSGAPVECRYDAANPPMADYAGIVGFGDPMKGSPTAPVTVIEIFEPNCPHCASLHPVMKQASERFGDQAKFYFKPVVFWEQSVAQVHSLYAAAQENKFFEMLDRQFAMQNPRGLTIDQLEDIAEEIGMNGAAMRQRVQGGTYNAQVNRDLMEIVQKRNVRSVPVVLINGRYVAGESRTVECIGQLISEAAAAGADARSVELQE